MAKYVCRLCGEAENCDFHCVLETPVKDDCDKWVCPLSGEEAEWYEEE